MFSFKEGFALQHRSACPLTYSMWGPTLHKTPPSSRSSWRQGAQECLLLCGIREPVNSLPRKESCLLFCCCSLIKTYSGSKRQRHCHKRPGYEQWTPNNPFFYTIFPVVNNFPLLGVINCKYLKTGILITYIKK